MKILFIGDIVGKNGRNIVKKVLLDIRKKQAIDFVIANGENATHGKGLIHNHYEQLLNMGIDVVTLGNHYLSKSEIKDYIGGADYLIRPYNIKNDLQGSGTGIFTTDGFKIRVTNLLGTSFMHEEVLNPFDCLSEIIDSEEKADIHIVDFHAEATGEKQALANAFDGRVTAVLGTHTHVQTRDLRLLKHGTAFISDVGMCGPYNGILGCKKEVVIERLWRNKEIRYEIAEDDDSLFSAVLLTINDSSLMVEETRAIYLVETKSS